MGRKVFTQTGFKTIVKHFSKSFFKIFEAVKEHPAEVHCAMRCVRREVST